MTLDPIPWAKPLIGTEERESLLSCFTADWLTMGPKVAELEQRMARRMQMPHAVAVSNGSVALDLALKALDLKPGDEVLVPAMTYFASAAAVNWQGAVPVFVDIDARSWNLDPGQLAAAVTERTRGVIYIDYGGNPADAQAIRAEAARLGLWVLHDGAQSLGATVGGVPCGRDDVISSLSFHMAKVITTVEGGMLFCHDGDLAAELRARRGQGEYPGRKYIHEVLGTNARMTDLAAAIGLAQLDRLDLVLEQRRLASLWYTERLRELAPLGLRTLEPGTLGRNAWFLYSVRLPHRDRVARNLQTLHRIETRTAYPLPLYRQPVYESGRAACRFLPCPVSESLAAEVLNLPLFPGITEEQQERVVRALELELRALEGNPA